MEGDAAYFGRRAAQEFSAAVETKDSAARRAHFELAARFNDLAHEIKEQERVMLAQRPEHVAANREDRPATGLWL